jgi:CO/xanthine dehydrogenase FAD-binding subunit
VRQFEYLRANSLKEACALLSNYKEDAKVLAGGQSLLTLLKMNMISPSYLIDIKFIPELNYMDFDEKQGLRIGALTTHRAVEKSALLKEKYPVLPETELVIASVQTRNWGTIGGTLVHADPIGDMAPPLIVMDSTVKLLNASGERTIPVSEFFVDFFMTVIGENEILKEIMIPTLPSHTGVAYQKFSIIEAGIKIAGAASLISLDGGKCKDAKIALSAVAPVPMRALKAEEELKGKTIDDKAIEKAAQAAATEADPVTDIHASAEYRRELVKVLVKRATKLALERAKSHGRK